MSLRQSRARSGREGWARTVGIGGRRARRACLPVAGALLAVGVRAAWAQTAGAPPNDPEAWSSKLWANIWDPWFVFGMVAQATFFLRFVVQWIVSERRRRSTIPVAFWYLSLIGGLLTFVYACKRADPVFMLGQLLACVIYIRNLMLIYGRKAELRRHGRGIGTADEPEIGDEQLQR